MRKEVLLAIVAGGLLGLTIAFGLWRANLALKESQKGSVPLSSPTPKVEFGISLARPEDGDVVTESSQVFSGITKPDAWAVISTRKDDRVLQAEADGSFSQEVELEGGVNQISISAFSENGEEAKQSLILVYSSEFAKLVSKTEEETGTAEADIRQKVIKRVEALLANPKAYLGIVTDIASGTLQIKTEGGEIKQISTQSDKITVIKVGKTNKEIKLTEIAIGDFIIAMGFFSTAGAGGKNGNAVLDARRILAMPPLTPLETFALFGTVVKLEKKGLTIRSLKDGSESKTSVDAKTNINREKDGKRPKLLFSNINEGDLVIAVISKDSGKARTILVIRQSAPSPSPTAE